MDFNKIEKKLINNKMELNYFVNIIGKKYKNFDNLKSMGLYAFWYYNKNQKINKLYRNLEINGPAKKKKSVEWNWNLDNEYICLYIGKTTTLKNRISQHLLLNTSNLKNINGCQLNRKTTSCQLRSGFDYLYSKTENINIQNELMEHLYLSIYYEPNFINRFYLEDYLIGKLKPWFNVDSER